MDERLAHIRANEKFHMLRYILMKNYINQTLGYVNP